MAKYTPFPEPAALRRSWPDKRITRAPIWCSVDLRDGNQALVNPMGVSEKLDYFDLLLELGFKEIEIGFPAASQIEFDFSRELIEQGHIPEGVAIQVLCQCREHLVQRTFESLAGAKKAIFHIYNSTSPVQRKVTFGKTKDEIKAIAVEGTRLVKGGLPSLPGTEVILEYSPESFSNTEVEYALEVCEAVMDVWGPTPQRPMILNLPSTVESSTPNLYADMIEWFVTHLSRRDSAIVSLHTHNDRGTGIAASELGLLAGADRVEGTLFGNGERTGNLDIVTAALNLYTHGIHPGLDFTDINAIRDVYERCTRMEVPARQPYAGELVFTAFSGSHQDAIKKSWAAQKPGQPWDVLYIPLDPADIGRAYKAIIRINSQSGKGGVAYIMEKEFGFDLPKAMYKEFGRVINDLADERKTEITPKEIHEAFLQEYIAREHPVKLEHFRTTERDSQVKCEAAIKYEDRTHKLSGTGNGPIDAFVNALGATGVPPFELLSYSEHSLGRGAEARAVSYIQIKTGRGLTFFGSGIDTNIELASIKALVSAVNRSFAKR